MSNQKLRRGVVAVICDSNGNLLVGERSRESGSWQLPQGGIEPNESPEEAVLRELREEIGAHRVRILRRSNEPIDYSFPPEIAVRLGFFGQRQYWFALSIEPEAEPDLSISDGTFSALDWQPPQVVLERVVAWKVDAYRRGLRSLSIAVDGNDA